MGDAILVGSNPRKLPPFLLLSVVDNLPSKKSVEAGSPTEIALVSVELVDVLPSKKSVGAGAPVPSKEVAIGVVLSSDGVVDVLPSKKFVLIGIGFDVLPLGGEFAVVVGTLKVITWIGSLETEPSTELDGPGGGSIDVVCIGIWSGVEVLSSKNWVGSGLPASGVVTLDDEDEADVLPSKN